MHHCQLTRAFVLIALLSLFGKEVTGHICIMIPSQRGGYDISDPGDPSCFAPNQPCGAGNRWWARPVGPPTGTLIGSTTYRVFFQQNLNHYTVGNPGYMYVAWSCGNTQTLDSQFAQLGGIPDHWARWQSSQMNYSLALSVPSNIEDLCPSGVATLQAIYHPNKPEEPIFHQCSDIAVASANMKAVSQSIGTSQPSLLGFVEEGNAFSFVEPLSGRDINRPPRTSANLYVPLVGTAAVDRNSSSTSGYFLASVQAPGGDKWSRLPPTALARFEFPNPFKFSGFDSQTIPLPTPAPTNSTFRWVAIPGIASDGQTVYLVGMLSDAAGNYFYQLFSFDLPSKQLKQLATSVNLNQGDFGFVNYMWSTYDPVSAMISILSGDENSNADPLNAAFVQFNLNSLSATFVELNVSAYTFENFQSIGGKLFAVSPGLVADGPSTPHIWSVVQFDGASGQIIAAVPIQPNPKVPSYFSQTQLSGSYRGGIINGVTETGLIVQLLFRFPDEAPILCYINPANGQIEWSTFLERDDFNYLVYHFSSFDSQ